MGESIVAKKRFVFDILKKKQSESIQNDCNELVSLLVSIVKTSKKNEGGENE